MFRSQTKCKHWLAEKSREPIDWLFYYYDSQSYLIINTHPPMLSSDLMTGTTGVKCERTLKMNPPTHSMCFCLVMTHCNVMTRPETTHSTESLCFCVSCYDSCSFIWWYGPYYDHTMVGSDFLMRPKLWMNCEWTHMLVRTGITQLRRRILQLIDFYLSIKAPYRHYHHCYPPFIPSSS